MPKIYADPKNYEEKLERVMSRLGVESFDYNWDRYGCWVEFYYKGQLYRFEHSLEKAANSGQKLCYGSDVFAQVVITLEDIARMTERGIYELQTFVAGMKALPAPKELPRCILLLGFREMPEKSQLEKRYRDLLKTAHPDVGGTNEHFMSIQSAYKEAVELVKEQQQWE